MLEALQFKIRLFNWTALIMIPDGSTPPALHDLIDQSRQVTIEHILVHAATCIGTQTRHAQDNEMLVQTLLGSMSTEALGALKKTKLPTRVNGAFVGALIIKVVTQDKEVETHATSFFTREQMTHLSSKIVELKCDIPAFNKEVVLLEESLARGGETSSDLFHHVLKAYENCIDTDFLYDVKDQRKRCESGEHDRTVDHLLLFGRNTCNKLVQRGTYGTPSKEQQEIIALTAKLEVESQERAKLEKSIKNLKGKSNGKGKRNGKSGGKSTPREKPAWMKVAPKDNKFEKTADGVKYFWCTEHKEWCRHTTEQCRKRKKRLAAEKAKDEKGNDEASENGGTLTMSTAISSILNQVE